jgi:polyhydroxyalkanoate synthesis repressor PhaR
MPLIKRYPNRKLYDTEAKKYITLAQIAALVREGKEIRVVDHATEDDLTAVTLTQVILEQERTRGGFLPQQVLAGLIQAGGERLGTLRSALSSPLELARHVDEEIDRRLQSLISRGELAAEEGRRLRQGLLGRRDSLFWSRWPTAEDVERGFKARGMPTHADLQMLSDQIDALTAKLDEAPREPDSP